MKPSLLICVLAATLAGNGQTSHVATASTPQKKDIAAIAKEANGAVVSIVMSDKEGHPVAQGSGFLISKDGWIMTNYHVIKTGSSAMIKLPAGAFFPVDGVVASDKDRDVAIIKAHGNDFRTLVLGDSSRLQVGEEVVAIGSPLSLESTVSNGIVSGIRTVEEEGGKFVQTTVPISPGSSGGPLFNMAGEVVGITTSHIKGGENLNFAIPINDVKPMIRSVSKVRSASVRSALPDEAEPVTAEQPNQPKEYTAGQYAHIHAHVNTTLYKQCAFDIAAQADGTVCDGEGSGVEIPGNITAGYIFDRIEDGAVVMVLSGKTRMSDGTYVYKVSFHKVTGFVKAEYLEPAEDQ